MTLIIVKGIDLFWGFGTTAEAENDGLDLSEHGEVGFDFAGGTIEEGPDMVRPEPRSAKAPPNGGGRFTIIVEGPAEKDLMAAWSKLCLPDANHPPEFRALYPLVTTVQGKRFRFRGGDHFDVRGNMKRLFEAVLNTPVQTHVEE